MASLTRWTWVWVNSGSWWWTGRPGVLRFMGSQRVGHDWATDLIWSDELYIYIWSIVDLQCFKCIAKWFIYQFSSVQSLSHVWLFANPWIAARQASLSITNSKILLKLNIHRIGDAIQPSHPLSSPSPPALIFPSIRVFSNESVLRIRWPKY